MRGGELDAGAQVQAAATIASDGQIFSEPHDNREQQCDAAVPSELDDDRKQQCDTAGQAADGRPGKDHG
jgi:hypothetical protein